MSVTATGSKATWWGFDVEGRNHAFGPLFQFEDATEVGRTMLSDCICSILVQSIVK